MSWLREQAYSEMVSQKHAFQEQFGIAPDHYPNQLSWIPAEVRNGKAQFLQSHVGLELYQFEPNFVSETARVFGLGRATGIEVVPEASGLIPDSAWKQATVGQGWVAGDSVNMAIGQGFVLATPLQVAMMMAAVINGVPSTGPKLSRLLSYRKLPRN